MRMILWTTSVNTPCHNVIWFVYESNVIQHWYGVSDHRTCYREPSGWFHWPSYRQISIYRTHKIWRFHACSNSSWYMLVVVPLGCSKCIYVLSMWLCLRNSCMFPSTMRVSTWTCCFIRLYPLNLSVWSWADDAFVKFKHFPSKICDLNSGVYSVIWLTTIFNVLTFMCYP